MRALVFSYVILCYYLSSEVFVLCAAKQESVGEGRIFFGYFLNGGGAFPGEVTAGAVLNWFLNGFSNIFGPLRPAPPEPVFDPVYETDTTDNARHPSRHRLTLVPKKSVKKKVDRNKVTVKKKKKKGLHTIEDGVYELITADTWEII